MHPIQHQLYTDHHHIQLVLNCLSKEIDCYDFNSHRSPDMAIILSALDYIRVYPNKWHQPAEDVIFDLLLKKNVKESNLIEQLKQEHKKIILETDKITQLFNTVASDCIVPANELLGSVRYFIKLQLVHLEKKNESIYPLMDHFTAKEWKEIESKVKIQNDPLFNKPSKIEYEHLYQYIMNLEHEK